MLFCGTLGTPYEPYGHCSLRESKRKNVRRPGGSPTGPSAKDWWIGEGPTKVRRVLMLCRTPQTLTRHSLRQCFDGC